jgi:hypothetical protein
VQHENLFEAAALWYRLNTRRPRRGTPSKLLDKLDRVARSAHRLLKNLGINDPDDAADGPGDREILRALVLSGEPNEDRVIEATRRIGRLAEIIDSVAAAAEFDRRAQQAAIAVAEVGKLTVREGNPGDDAVNDWIAEMRPFTAGLPAKSPQRRLGVRSAPMKALPRVP